MPRSRRALARLGVPVTPFGLSAAADPRAALAALRGIFVRRRFSPMGRTVRAAGSHPRVARLLTVLASARCVPARRGDLPGETYRRPPTSCAHRLRKPDRTNELLAFSVARWTRGRGLLPVPLPAPRRASSRLQRLPCGDAAARKPPSCQARRCRRRVRTTTTGWTRTPSIGSTRALRYGWARLRVAVHVRRRAPHPVARCEPVPPRQGQVGRLELPRAPASASPSTFVAGSGAAFTAGKMRLTDFCNRLPSRAPCGSLDSRLRPGALRLAAPRVRAPTHPGREPRRRGWGACRPFTG
jgi:hypothetical protein